MGQAGKLKVSNYAVGAVFFQGDFRSWQMLRFFKKFQ